MEENVTDSGLKQKRSSRANNNDAKSKNWRFLFDNMKRSVGYIYSMCEQDGDVEECKEAIMVLNNLIKEFEGLIQYIEVQASYETSDQRPSSVAWEVPVSAQPTLPFQPNGDQQFYYYPYMPQVYPQYPVPGSFPMMDPNMVNFIPYGQQFPGFLPEFMSQPNTPSAQPNHSSDIRYNQYYPVQDFNSGGDNNTSNNCGQSKKSFNKHHCNTKKSDIFNNKSRLNSDKKGGHKSPKKTCTETVSQSSSNLNDLDIVSDDTFTNLDSAYKTLPTVQSNECASNTSSEIHSNDVIGSHLTNEINSKNRTEQDTSSLNPKDDLESSTNHLDTLEHDHPELESIVESIHDELSSDSLKINEKIAEAIDDKSSLEDIPSLDKDKTEWTVVNKSSENFIHVSSDGSVKIVPASPDRTCADETNISTGNGTDVTPESTSADQCVHGSTDVTADSGPPKDDLKIEKKEQPDVTNLPEETVTLQTAFSKQESTLSDRQAEPVKEENMIQVQLKEVSDNTTDVNELDTEKSSTTKSGWKTSLISEKQNVHISKPDKALPHSNEIQQEKDRQTSFEMVENTGHITVEAASKPELRAKKESECRELDTLSESGLSTMSSGSVRSCMSLPPNPLARSTSWADLVKKGKSESPLPPATRKIPLNPKYQHTPSRYLSHTLSNKTGNSPAEQQYPLTKSKSIPQRPSSNRSLTALLSHKKNQSKEPHVSEDGWSISSGKNRVKTIPNSKKVELKSVPSSQLKPSEKTKSPASSPRLGIRSINKHTPGSNKNRTEIQARNSRCAKTNNSSSKPLCSATPKVATKPSRSRSPTVSKKTSNCSFKSSNLVIKNSAKPVVKSKPLENNKKPKSSTIQLKKKISKDLELTEKESNNGESINIEFQKIKDIINQKDETVTETNNKAEIEIKQHDVLVEQNDVLVETKYEDTSEVNKEDEEVDSRSEDMLCESKCIQTDFLIRPTAAHTLSQQLPYSLQIEEEDPSNTLKLSSRQRQISEHSSISNCTDTLEEEDRLCLSPGRSPGKSPGGRSPGSGRSPGKAPQLHQRLSSPSRRRNTVDTLKNYQERLAKAQLQRDKIQEEKANKLKKIKIKEEQIRDIQEQQEKERVQRGISHAEKLLRAEQLREEKLAEIKRKAQEEEQKVSEIAFINTLEAQNRKMELLSKEQSAEAKRAELQVRMEEERKRKAEGIQAREDAVLERKQVIEADRLARIAHIEDRIKESQAKVDLNKSEREAAREEAAKDRARERELMLEFVRQDKGAQKPDKRPPSRGGKVNKLKEIQDTAAILCRDADYSPSHTLYDPAKWCSRCNIKIISEAFLMSHMVKRHQKTCQIEAEQESQYIIDYTDELCPMATEYINRQKMLRKRAKKVKTRITNKLSEIEMPVLDERPKDFPNKNRLNKCVKAINSEKSREKGLSDLSRMCLADTDVSHLIDSGVIQNLCNVLSTNQLMSPLSKLLLQCCSVSPIGCKICVRYITEIADCLHYSMSTPLVYNNLLKLTTCLVRSLKHGDNLTSDVISYIVSKEIIDNIQLTCQKTTHLQIDSQTLINSLSLLSACCVSMTKQSAPLSTSPLKSDLSQLVETLIFTKSCNIITLLYGVLLYDGPPRKSCPPPLSDVIQTVVKQCLSTLVDIARFSLHTLQTVMDTEGTSLELRHVCSYILWSASHHHYKPILDDCIKIIGFVVFRHPTNQILLQNGPSPSILQLLCSLPFPYFSDAQSMELLFPALISACYNCASNLVILQEKVNKVMLISYLKDALKNSEDLLHIDFYPKTTFIDALKYLECFDAASS